MADATDRGTARDMDQIGDAAATITTLARTHRITADTAPIDTFVDAVARLSNAKVTLDRIDLLLLGLARAGVVTDAQRFALHTAHLHRETGRSTFDSTQSSPQLQN